MSELAAEISLSTDSEPYPHVQALNKFTGRIVPGSICIHGFPTAKKEVSQKFPSTFSFHLRSILVHPINHHDYRKDLCNNAL